MKKLKLFVCLVLTMVLLCQNTSVVRAAGHVSGCTSTSTTVSCGAFVSTAVMGTHTVKVNNSTVTCTMTAEMHFHTVTCSGCGAVLATNVVKTCIMRHTHCSTETGLCK